MNIKLTDKEVNLLKQLIKAYPHQGTHDNLVGVLAIMTGILKKLEETKE